MKLSMVWPGFIRYRVRMAFFSCGFVVLLAGWGCIAQYRERRSLEGKQARQLAESAQLVEIGRPSEIELGTLLTIASMKRVPQLENDQALRKSMQLLRLPVSWIHHDGPVRAVTYSGDGRWGATASEDGTAVLFEAATGANLAVIRHKGVVTSIAFDSASALLATGSLDTTVRIVDLGGTSKDNHRMVLEKQFGSCIVALAFRPWKRQVAVGTNDNTVVLFDVDTQKEVLRRKYGDSVRSVAFSPDGTLLGVASLNKVSIIDLPTNQDIAFLSHDNYVNSVEFSPNGQRVATASNDRTARVFEARTGKEVKRLIHPKAVTRVTFSPDGDKLVTGGEDNAVRVFDLNNACEEIAHFVHEGPVRSVRFTQNGQDVITGSDDHTARIFSVESGRELGRLSHSSPVVSLALSADGNQLATASGDGVRIFQLRDLNEITRLDQTPADRARFAEGGKKIAIAFGNKASVFDGKNRNRLGQFSIPDPASAVVAVSANGQMLAIGGVNNAVNVFDLSTGLSSARREEHSISAVSFRGDGKVLAIAIGEPTGEPSQPTRGVIKWIDSRTGNEVLPRLTCICRINALAISFDLHFLAAGTDDRGTVVFDLKANTNHTLAYEKSVNTVAFSDDSQWLAVGGEGKITKLFDLNTNTEINPSFSSEGIVSRIVFDHERSRLAIVNLDSTLHVFDIAQHVEVAQIAGTNVEDIAFDGADLLTLSIESNSIRVRQYHLKPEELIDQACSLLVNKDLRSDQWNHYFPNEHHYKICPSLP